jgi:integrase
VGGKGGAQGGAWCRRLLAMLKRLAYLEQGCPDCNEKVCPSRGNNSSRYGLLNITWLGVRVREAWKTAGLTPITPQESRHTATTWLDAASRLRLADRQDVVYAVVVMPRWPNRVLIPRRIVS